MTRNKHRRSRASVPAAASGSTPAVAPAPPVPTSAAAPAPAPAPASVVPPAEVDIESLVLPHVKDAQALRHVLQTCRTWRNVVIWQHPSPLTITVTAEQLQSLMDHVLSAEQRFSVHMGQRTLRVYSPSTVVVDGSLQLRSDQAYQEAEAAELAGQQLARVPPGWATKLQLFGWHTASLTAILPYLPSMPPELELVEVTGHKGELEVACDGMRALKVQRDGSLSRLLLSGDLSGLTKLDLHAQPWTIYRAGHAGTVTLRMPPQLPPNLTCMRLHGAIGVSPEMLLGLDKLVDLSLEKWIRPGLQLGQLTGLTKLTLEQQRMAPFFGFNSLTALSNLRSLHLKCLYHRELNFWPPCLTSLELEDCTFEEEGVTLPMTVRFVRIIRCHNSLPFIEVHSDARVECDSSDVHVRWVL